MQGIPSPDCPTRRIPRYYLRTLTESVHVSTYQPSMVVMVMAAVPGCQQPLRTAQAGRGRTPSFAQCNAMQRNVVIRRSSARSHEINEVPFLFHTTDGLMLPIGANCNIYIYLGRYSGR